MKHIINFFPNILTLLNLSFGFIGILFWQHNIYIASICVFIAIIFDFLDGFVARLLNSVSSIGKELDSLADIVSFGVLPALIVFKLLNPDFIWMEIYEVSLLSFSVLLIPVFSALRLAKFNVEDSQKFWFKGLPTPANAMWIASLPFIIHYSEQSLLLNFFSNYNNIIVTAIIGAFLLIIPLPLMALKFESFNLRKNIFKYLLIISSVLLFILFQWSAFPIIICLYIILSFLDYFL